MRRSSWWPAATRAWSGTGPGTCCACVGCCGSSFRQRWRPSLIWTRRTPWSCSRPRPTRTGPRGVSRAKITATLRRANRRGVEDKAAQIQSVLRAPALRQPVQVQVAFAAIVASQVRLIGTLNGEIAKLGEVVAGHFGRHREAEIYTSQPGLGVILAAESWPSSEMTAPASPTRKHARTTPAPHRSPAPRAPARSCWPATPATLVSATPSSSGPSAR